MLRAAYPDERFEFRKIWGAYMAAYGFNNVVPARGGDIIKLFLTKTSIPNSSYPAVGSSFFVEAIFDLCMAIPILTFAFTQGAFPKPPDFSKIPAFDLAFFASNPRFTLFVLTVLGILVLVALRAAVARACGRSGRACARASRSCATAGATSARSSSSSSAAGCCASPRSGSCSTRSTSAARSRTCCSCWASTRSPRCVPFTPGGAGVQQALLVKVFAGSATGATVAAYSVGQQIAIAAPRSRVGFGAIVFIFRFRSFKEVIAAGREARGAEA